MNTLLFLCRANHYRSRFAEIFFNWHATQQGLPWRAESRGLNIDPRNPGHISRHAISRLLLQKITLDAYRRFPMDFTLTDSQSAHGRRAARKIKAAVFLIAAAAFRLG